ncbi:MAG: hypothetical protein JO317_02365, partial [Verrucomicrobiae bacterium]|nr:hypothetical protein [Verrucomicrobiae bacterium]
MKILLSFALLFAFNLPSCDSDKAKQEEQGRESISAAQDLKAKADIQNLQNGILAFQAHFDRNPASLDELAKSGLIQAIPQPNEGQKYVYDPASGRVTVEAALQQGIPIIPVLVSGATIPKVNELPLSLQTLSYLNAAEVDGGRDFHQHMDRLIQAIDAIRKAGGGGPSERRRKWLLPA